MSVPTAAAIRALPKVELHTHFHGNIRQASLKRLLEERRPRDPRLREVSFEPAEPSRAEPTQARGTAEPSSVALNRGGEPSVIELARDRGGKEAEVARHKALDECFAYFELVYLIVDDRDTIALLAREVLSDFAADNVKYLELRTTPRAVARTGLTKEAYAETFIDSVRWANASPELDIAVRVIWSLNRGRLTCSENAEEDVAELLRLAERYPDVTVGIDIAGDPGKGDLSLALPLLHRAILAQDATHKHLGLKLTVHTAEAEGTEAETDSILALGPHRLGHCCYLTPAQEALVMASGACVECCPTSNYHSRRLASLADHHFKTYWAGGHPHLAICTDDTGLFNTSLSEELAKLAAAFSLSINDLAELQRAALASSFADPLLKAHLAAVLQSDPGQPGP